MLPYAVPCRILAGFVLSCAALVAASSTSVENFGAAPTRVEVSEKRNELAELRGQIEALRKEMAAAVGRRATASDQVKDVEREISTTQRELHTLSRRKNSTQATLKDLGRQEQVLNKRLDELRAQMENLVYRRYLQGQPSALRLLLNGEDANQMTRDLYYLGVIGQAHRQLRDETESLLERKRMLSGKARERAAELSSIEAKQKEQHTRLVARREQRKEVLGRISSRIARQREEIGNLRRDEKALAQLVTQLERIIAAQRKAPGRPPESSRAPGTNRKAAPAGAFAPLKGRLRLPVRGTVTNRYGSRRQEGSTWKGLFIRAAQGSEVKAIADGRVVFSDWMRGFGNLLIVDHGNSYLSIYGYNDAVLTQVGDEVRGGDPIATAGNSGGNPESGLYFELRHQGQPVDPLKWVSLK
jgi:septal ring factor EnvC (AmiA/AmiB activator)